MKNGKTKTNKKKEQIEKKIKIYIKNELTKMRLIDSIKI